MVLRCSYPLFTLPLLLHQDGKSAGACSDNYARDDPQACRKLISSAGLSCASDFCPNKDQGCVYAHLCDKTCSFCVVRGSFVLPVRVKLRVQSSINQSETDCTFAGSAHAPSWRPRH